MQNRDHGRNQSSAHGTHCRCGSVVRAGRCYRAPVASHKKINEAVVIKIGRDGRHPINVGCDTGLVGYIRELAVSVIPIQMIVREFLRLLLQWERMYTRFQRLAARDIEVRQSIVVEVEPHASSARTLKQRTQLEGTGGGCVWFD